MKRLLIKFALKIIEKYVLFLPSCEMEYGKHGERITLRIAGKNGLKTGDLFSEILNRI